MIHHYFCISCDVEFTAVIHYGITSVVQCPFCHSKKNLPTRKRIYYLNHNAGFIKFKDKSEMDNYHRDKVNARNLVGNKKRRKLKKLRS